MTAVEQYNALDGKTVSREELKKIIVLGIQQGQKTVAEKIQAVLSEFDDQEFHVTVSETAIDTVPVDCLNTLDCIVPDEKFTGLEKAISPDQIYQMITDKMLAQLKEATGKGYKKKWKMQNEEGYLIPFNFESKKQYRGINIALLTEGMSKVLKNPYFLTFKQIEKFKGKLKKGSKGLPVVYFTMLYAVSETNENGKKIEFGTYNKAKYITWITKNISRLKFSLEYYKNQYIPILKYYNVFNGADVEGIDFDLDNFKIGYQDGSEVVKNNDHRVQIADLIVKNYPAPQPKLQDSKDGRAFYRHGYSVDEIHMPKIEDFETGLDYYRPLLHEFTHSTGISTRLDRPMGGKFGSPQYAKEELVAEFGAVFLSAHAGIIWYNQNNHAEYLKNWNSVLTYAKDDNRFIMRAASKAQEAADYVLNLKEGIPAYQKELESAVTSKTTLLAKATKNKKVGSLKKKKPDTNELLEKSKKIKVQARRKKKAVASSNGQLGLFGVVPANLTLKGTMEFAEKNIIGKSFFVKALGEEVFFNKGKLKKAMNHPRGSKENLALVYKLPIMLEKAVLLTEQPDKKKRQEIKKVFKLILIEELFGEIYRVLITVRKQDKNYYYDHSIIDKIKPERQDGSVNKVNPIPLDVASPVPYKYKKEKNNGLKSPVETPTETVATIPPEVKPVVEINPENYISPSMVAATKVLENAAVAVPNSSGAKSLTESMRESAASEVFEVPGDIGRFLGRVEKKPVHSVVTTLDAEQGAGKTRIFFQIMNVLAGMGKRCLFISLEEHPASKLFKDKVDQYIDPANLHNISVIDEVEDWVEVKTAIEEADITFIDSFQKLPPNLDLDKNIRKAFNGKWFFIIYQQTGTKGMRGGSKAAFDGDQILKVFKDPEDYRNNYVYANKNRYNDAPDLKLNIFTGALVKPEKFTDVSDITFKEVEEQPANSRIPLPTSGSGRLIATPIM